jgi:hypothetical protein
MKIVEVFPGTVAAPNAQYIVLQMYAAGQTLVSGHAVRVFNAAGTEVGTFNFSANVSNGTSQAKILIATTEAATLFGVAPNLTMTAVIPLAGGKVCFDASLIDCAAWGNYTPVDVTVGPPFNVSLPCVRSGLLRDRAMVRNLKGNTTLEATDDTNNSAADFLFGAPAPKNNAGITGTLPASTCGNGIIQSLETCDDGGSEEFCGDCVVQPAAGECCDPAGPSCLASCKTNTVPTEVSPPGSVEPLRFIDSDTLQWEAAASSGSNNFTTYRGTLPGVRLGDYGSCLGSGILVSTMDDAATPAARQAFTYVVAGRDALDCEGPLGDGSTGAPRPNQTPCP